jgi:hypothetical protein
MGGGVRGAFVCRCVLRAIFCETYRAFLLSRFDVDNASRRGRIGRGGCKRAEFVADFERAGAKALQHDRLMRMAFRLHFLQGLAWRDCCAQMGIDRGAFFHAVYKLEARLGMVYSCMKPFRLFPTREYFGGKITKNRVPREVLEMPQIPMVMAVAA